MAAEKEWDTLEEAGPGPAKQQQGVRASQVAGAAVPLTGTCSAAAESRSFVASASVEAEYDSEPSLAVEGMRTQSSVHRVAGKGVEAFAYEQEADTSAGDTAAASRREAYDHSWAADTPCTAESACWEVLGYNSSLAAASKEASAAAHGAPPASGDSFRPDWERKSS